MFGNKNFLGHILSENIDAHLSDFTRGCVLMSSVCNWVPVVRYWKMADDGDVATRIWSSSWDELLKTRRENWWYRFRYVLVKGVIWMSNVLKAVIVI